MFRTSGDRDDKLTVVGVQVLQVEGGVGNDHTCALVHSDGLQHHLRGLIILSLHRPQRHRVKKGKWPRGKDRCPPELNTSYQMTVLVLIPINGLHQSLQIYPAPWLLLRRRHQRNKPWGRGCSLASQVNDVPVLGEGNR